MSGWDAPTGSWDSGEEPEGSRSDDQGYQQAQRAGGYRARGDSVLRAGRRGLPGYDQAQSYDQSGGYDQGTVGGYDQGTAAYGPGAGTQEFRQQQPADAGHGQQPGADQDYRTQAFGQQGYGQGAQDYQTEAYPQQGFEPSGNAQGGYPGQGYGHSGYDQNGYDQNGHGQNGYGQPGYGQGGYSPDAYRQDAYGQGGYSPDAYRQDAYGQPGLDLPGGPDYGDEPLGAPRVQPRSGRSRPGQRSPQRLSGIRMVLYLLAAVLGVVLIVLLVIRLTGSNTTAGAASSPSTSPGTAAGTGSGFVFTKAAKVGTFPLNAAATANFTGAAGKQVTPIVAAIEHRRAGHVGNELVAAYDLTPVASPTAGDFKAIGFVGFGGTFKPNAVIKYMKTQLTSTRTVNPGPHGGKMICGYNTSSGTKASECLWVTPTTFGMVQFIHGQVEVKYAGASNLALETRNAVEVKAG